MAKKAIKFTKKEQQKITKLGVDISTVFTQLGQLGVERKQKLEELKKIEESLHDRYDELKQEQQDLFKTLSDVYGDGNYNPETGEFTPIDTKSN